MANELRSFQDRACRAPLGRPTAILAALALGLGVAACGGSDSSTAVAEPAPATPSAQSPGAAAEMVDLGGIKNYLLEHTQLLTRFTSEFEADAERYYDLAEAAGFDYERLYVDNRDELTGLLGRMKSDWVKGNPYYEQMEGIVAGTPSLAEYDVAIDAGANGAEDPESAVPFDLKLPDGTVLEQPGNFYNLTEGALWGTLPETLPQGTPADLDGDGTTGFGDVLPHAGFLVAAARDFDLYANRLAGAARAWEPQPSDAFTALVVMVPTMSEYFGQWKVSRFVLGERADGEAFNVVSRLSDINDILSSLQVIYDGVRPLAASVDQAQSAQTETQLDGLRAFIDDLHAREEGGARFTPEQADALGSEAQERGTAIAGQISQVAAQLGIEIEQ